MHAVFHSLNQAPATGPPVEYTHDFWFNPPVGLDGWSAVPVTGDVQMSWQKPRNTSLRPSPPISLLRGKLRTTAMCGAASGQSQWERVATWQDLGVPAGKTVTKVRASYLFRYYMKPWTASAAQMRNADFLEGDSGSGPFEVYRNTGGLPAVATLSDFQPCIQRPSGGHGMATYWYADPLGSSSDPCSLTPVAWYFVDGADQTVAGTYAASSTSLLLRMNVLTPDVGLDIYSSVRIWHNAFRFTVTAV